MIQWYKDLLKLSLKSRRYIIRRYIYDFTREFLETMPFDIAYTKLINFYPDFLKLAKLAGIPNWEQEVKQSFDRAFQYYRNKPVWKGLSIYDIPKNEHFVKDIVKYRRKYVYKLYVDIIDDKGRIIEKNAIRTIETDYRISIHTAYQIAHEHYEEDLKRYKIKWRFKGVAGLFTN